MSMDLLHFQTEQVLNILQEQRKIVLWGNFKSQQKALLIITPKIFDIKQLGESKIVQETFSNDIYRSYDISSLNESQVELVYPATQKHYQKYLKKKLRLTKQTVEVYKNKKQKIQTQVTHNQWIYNILQGKSQVQRVLYRQEGQQGFIIIPDSKFINNNSENLHLLALVNQKSLYTIRDLSKKDIEMLKRIQSKAQQIIQTKYSIFSHRAFFHYPPTFYHLHIHFMSLSINNASTQMERCHDLLTVIQNLEIKSEYYQEATLNVLQEQQ